MKCCTCKGTADLYVTIIYSVPDGTDYWDDYVCAKDASKLPTVGGKFYDNPVIERTDTELS